MFVEGYDSADKTLPVLLGGADGRDSIVALVFLERVATVDIMELRNAPLASVTGELGTALVGPFKDVGAFSTLLLVTEVPLRTVVYERTKSVAVVVTPA